MKQFIRRNKSVVGISVLSLVLVGVVSWSWWHYIYSNPKRVFNRMLSQSLSTPTVVKTTIDQDSSLNQTTQLSVNPEALVRSESKINQSDSSITTESIATPEADYVRYTKISTSQKGQDGKPLDFSQVLGLWGRSTNADVTSTGAQLFNQTSLGVVPMGRLKPEARNALLKQIAETGVYSVDYSNVTRRNVGGRPVYEYKVGLSPRAYVTMLKSFSKALGENSLEQVDPNDYPESPNLNVGIYVDVWSSNLREITYENSNRTEIFSSHGGYVRPADLPTDAVPVEELQAKLQQIR